MNGGWAFAGDTRVRRKVDDTYTFYHADCTEYSFDADTGTGYFTYYHQMSGRMIGFTRSDTDVTTWTGNDIVGSTSTTRNENGQVATHRYTPFGETRTDGNLDTDHLFTGQILDESSGLAFYNARYYDPAIGRFITPDSIVPNPLNGQDYNRYTYVRNNPIKYNDPTGNCPTLCTAQDRADVNYVLARTSEPQLMLVTPTAPVARVGPAAQAIVGAIGVSIADLVCSIFCGDSEPVELLTQAEIYGLTQQQYNTCLSTPAGSGQSYDFCDTAGLYGVPNAFPTSPTVLGANASNLPPIATRVEELHNALDPIAQNSRTTAAMRTTDGTDAIASDGRDLSPAQRALTTEADVLGKLPGVHAEITALDAALRAGLTPAEIAVSRPICDVCRAAIESRGGRINDDGLGAVFPR